MKNESFTGSPVVLTIPVLWGDQDALAHVNNIVYLRWCETARIGYLERAGLWRMFEEEGVGPIVARITCDYRRPLAFPDTVYVDARVSRIGNSSFQMDHKIVSAALDTVAAEVSSTLVVYDYRANKATPMPLPVREAIGKLEGGAL
jgi:acyl-CoA thioester hydrolase